MTTAKDAHRRPARARPLTALRRSPYFVSLPQEWLQRLAAAASPETYRAGDEVALETGQDGTPRLYLVVRGEIAVSTPPDRAGVVELVDQEGVGAVFGSRLLTREEELRTYHAVTAVDLLAWDKRELERLLGELPALRRELETRLSLRRRQSELVELLAQSPPFRQVSRSLIKSLVRSATLRWCEAGSVIFRHGERGDAMFLIVSGDIEVAFPARAEDETRAFRHLHRGDFFGEIALLEESTRTATAVAVSDAELLRISDEEFQLLYSRSASFGRAVRLTAQLRQESAVLRLPDPELVWVVNDTASGSASEDLAGLIRSSLQELVGELPPAHRPGRRTGVDDALEAGRRHGAPYVLCHTEGSVDQSLERQLAERAGAVVHVTSQASTPLAHGVPGVHGVHHLVLAPTSAIDDSQLVRRDAFQLRLAPSEITHADPDLLPGHARAVLGRLARAIARRRVGIALGGGAAWGYAHVVLLRGLERAEIPVDILVGASMGSMVGAFYASQGTAGLDKLVEARFELAATVLAGIGTSTSADLFLRRHLPERKLEDMPLPFATVAVDASNGQEKVFRRGSLAAAVRASCSLPGIIGRPLLGGHRYLDACVRHNVPASCCIEADSDFVIACDVVPSPQASRDMPTRGGIRALVLELSQINRLTDTVRSLYWLASDSGRRQAGPADVVFTPHLPEFFPWDFHRAEAIVEKAEEQLDDWLQTTQSRYRALSPTA